MAETMQNAGSTVESVTAAFALWLRRAKEERWGLWRGSDAERMEKLARIVAGICQELRIPVPMLRLAPSVGDTLGVTYLNSGLICVNKPSVVTTMHELAHWACEKLDIPNTERNARDISLRSFFEVWPEKRNRPDILYKDEL